jgi:hypothetical protein
MCQIGRANIYKQRQRDGEIEGKENEKRCNAGRSSSRAMATLIEIFYEQKNGTKDAAFSERKTHAFQVQFNACQPRDSAHMSGLR